MKAAKSMQYTLKRFLFFLLVLPVGSSAQAGELPVEVSDYRLDRLYFSIGEEARIYEHSRFTILRGDDSLYAGRIEHAWQGVAISSTTDRYFDSLDTDSIHAMIETAEIDTISIVVIGTDLSGLQLWSEIAPGDRIDIREYDDRQSMLEDFESDQLDGVLSFQNLSPHPEDVTTISEPAPYLAALIPHVGRQVNFQGQLTTSLYYRSDRAHLARSFDGDLLVMTNRFEADPLYDQPPGRLFEYNPVRGRQLFDQMTFSPASIALHSGHTALNGLAHYLADIVSRDRCAVRLVDNPGAADVRLAFVPVSRTLPSVSVYSIFHQLIVDSVADMAAGEHVRRIAAELKYVESPPRPEDYFRHLRRAGRIMIEDLGLFPLFRPTVFLHTHRQLQDFSFNDDGQIDFSSGILLKLPQEPEADTP